MVKKRKVLYLYSLLRESGLGYLKCSELVQELRKHFIVDLRYAIFPDDDYSKLDQYTGAKPGSLKEQIISESRVSEQGYSLIFIEHRLRVTSNKKSEKARADFLKAFRENGGSIILNLTEQIDSAGDPSKLESSNNFLKEVGLPAIRTPSSKDDFPDMLVDSDSYQNQIIRGCEFEEKNRINRSYTYYSIEVNEKFLAKIATIFHPVFENVGRLVVETSVQLEGFPNQMLLVGNTSTQMITSGDLRWDASPCHIFGAVNDTFGGCAVTLTGYLFDDQIIKLQETDNIRFAVNLVDYLIGQRGLPLSEEYPDTLETMDTASNDAKSSLFPIEIVQKTRGYIEGVAVQANNCYSTGCYDACAVMIRRLIETLIIECFEAHGIHKEVQDSAGNYPYLRDLIKKILELHTEGKLNIGRNSRESLKNLEKTKILKQIGDLSAHSRYFLAKKGDLDDIRLELRVVIQELVHIAKLDKNEESPS
jgi:hypothetical protein